MEVSRGSRHVGFDLIGFNLQGILDFSRPVDVPLLDKVVMAFYTGAGREVRCSRHARRAQGLTRSQPSFCKLYLLATNGSTSFDPISRASRDLAECPSYSGKLDVRANQGGNATLQVAGGLTPC